jgi:hypothetical protein
LDICDRPPILDELALLNPGQRIAAQLAIEAAYYIANGTIKA